MRFAVISDIHGNLVALDAVLDDLASDDYDELICLGDVAANGPRPVECLHRIQDLGCPVVMGTPTLDWRDWTIRTLRPESSIIRW